jgi:uncharacterized protein (DUF952 family)
MADDGQCRRSGLGHAGGQLDAPVELGTFGLVLIYKILLPAEWDAFEAAGRFDGSSFDRESGFIHLSSRDQVAETARRIFAGEPALVVVAIDDSVLAGTLRWETTSDRGRFPHVYGSLPQAAVVAMYAVAGAAGIDDALPANGTA